MTQTRNYPHCLICNKQLGDYRSRYCKSHSKKSEKNPQWKGNKVGYTALHNWIKSRLSKPQLCENCKKQKPYDLANKSGNYKRDINDWKWLCRRCHMKEDGRLKIFLSTCKGIKNKKLNLTPQQKKKNRQLYYQKNKEKIKLRQKEYNEKPEIKKKRKEYMKKYNKEYSTKSREVKKMARKKSEFEKHFFRTQSL